MKIYNTLSNSIEEFKPEQKDTVTMYNCGPTVYGYAHIGNFASFLFADFLRRALEYNGYTVKQIMNITDVGHLVSDADEGEDKVIKKAQEEGKTPEEIARYFEDAFFIDAKSLNIKRAAHHPRATEHIQEMIDMIEKLIQKGHAYEKDGNVYFDVESFKKYGEFSGNTLEQLKQNVRSETKKDPKKKNPHDFVLWFKAPENHLMQWSSPWSTGYPGWHIECSAMSAEYLKAPIDIHTGGEDHIFPHHEAEIAQSECALGKKSVNYWMHRRHIMVDGEKMSKSKGNILTIKDLKEKGFDPLVFRFFIFSTHYRQKAKFTLENLEHAQKGLQRITDTIIRLHTITNTEGTNLEASALIGQARDDFNEAINNDLNTPQALAAIYDLIKNTNKFIEQGKINRNEAQGIVEIIEQFDQIIGVISETLDAKNKKIPEKIKELVAKRETAREEKNFDEADKIRKKIESHGFILKDTPRGPEIKTK